MITINEKSYEYIENLTIQDAIELVCNTIDPDYIVGMNGKFILRSQWNSTIVPDGAKLLFIPIIAGG